MSYNLLLKAQLERLVQGIKGLINNQSNRIDIINHVIDLKQHNMLKDKYQISGTLTQDGLTITFYEDGSIKLNGTSTDANFFSIVSEENPIPISAQNSVHKYLYGLSTNSIRNLKLIIEYLGQDWNEYDHDASKFTEGYLLEELVPEEGSIISDILYQANATFDNVIVYPTLIDLDDYNTYYSQAIENKQDILTAGPGITITNNVISAEGVDSSSVLITTTEFNNLD